MQGAWNNEEITNHPKSINSSGQNIAKSENQYGGNNKFKQKIQFGYDIPLREDQRDDNMAESEGDGAEISGNRNIPATNNDNFIFELNGGHIITYSDLKIKVLFYKTKTDQRKMTTLYLKTTVEEKAATTMKKWK